MKIRRVLSIFLSAILGLLLVVAAATRTSADTNAVPTNSTAATNSASDAASLEILRAYLQIQDQLHSAQEAIEQNRQQSVDALGRMEKVIAAQKLDEMKDLQHSNSMMLIAAGVFTALAFLVLLVTAFLQWSAVHRLAGTTAVTASPRSLSPSLATSALGLNESALNGGAVAESNGRLLGILERLENRLAQMEGELRIGRALPESNGDSHGQASPSMATMESAGVSLGATPAGSPEARAIGLLVKKGDSLMKLDQAADALACYEQVLANDSANADVLLRKGLALERLHRWPEALACYDIAIAVNQQLTMAYLYKAAVLNRLERYPEALECYELALKVQEKNGSGSRRIAA